MITSPKNEKLKLVRKLAGRRAREREGLFVTEGEDLVTAGLASGAEPLFLLRAADGGDAPPNETGEGTIPGWDAAEPVAVELLAGLSLLGSGTRLLGVWPQAWAEPSGPVCLYLDGVRDPGNVGTIIRSADALIEGSVVIGAGSADPYSPKAVRAAMGSIFRRPPARAAIDATPAPRLAMVAHGGDWPPPADWPTPTTICLGGEREGLTAKVSAACDRSLTIPLRSGGAESLNVAGAAAICCERISSRVVTAAGSSDFEAKGNHHA